MQYTFNNSVRKYANCLLSCSTKCIINQPTRITAHAKTLLDHIYVNSEQINVNGGIARLELADHLPTFALIPKTKDKIPKTSPNFFKRDMKCFQLDLFLDDLNLKLNKTSFEDFSVDESFENFLNIFADIVNTHAPLRKCTRKEKKLKVKPWLNKTLLKSIKKKNNMFKDLHKNFNQQSFHKYKAYRNALNRTIQGAKQMYYNKYFSSNKNNPAKIWDAIHELADLKPKKNITINRLMKENGDFVEEPKDVAQLLNKYFVDIGKNMAKAIPPIHSTYKPPPSTYSKNSLFMSPTTPEEIANVITSLINKKAIRSKDIETYFIKISGVIIASILSKLFNQCLLEGEFPKCLKIAEVIPIFKKGSAINVLNYRPISLLSQFDKIFEKIIYNRIINFIEKYNLLSDHQFGFRQNSSTIYAVTYIYDNLIKNVDKGFYSFWWYRI